MNLRVASGLSLLAFSPAFIADGAPVPERDRTQIVFSERTVPGTDLNLLAARTDGDKAYNPHDDPGKKSVQLGNCGECHGRVGGRLPGMGSPPRSKSNAIPNPSKSGSLSGSREAPLRPQPASNADPGQAVRAAIPNPGGIAKPLTTAPNPNRSEDLKALANLKPGQWYEVRNSRMKAVDPCPADDCPYSGSTGQASVMLAWSGGAYDPIHDKLLIHGGGHTNYAGNEVYAFDVNALQWERLTDPSADRIKNALWFPDGAPNSSHTYDNLEYVPEINALCVFGNGSRWQNGYDGPSTACLDMSTCRWSKKTDIPKPGHAMGGKSAYDPVTRSVWRHHAGPHSFLHRYDSGQDSWQNFGTPNSEGSSWISYNTTAAIDPERRLFIAVGGGEVRVWDMAGLLSSGVATSTSGDAEIVDKMNPGLEYDPVIGKLVAWAGGGDVYTLDTGTWVWSKVPLAADNRVVPTAAQNYGTYGRFRYVPSKNLYIAVNAVNQNVYFFRLSQKPGSD